MNNKETLLEAKKIIIKEIIETLQGMADCNFLNLIGFERLGSFVAAVDSFTKEYCEIKACPKV